MLVVLGDKRQRCWIKRNFDTGAAVTAFPNDFAATGQFTTTFGRVRISGRVKHVLTEKAKLMVFLQTYTRHARPRRSAQALGRMNGFIEVEVISSLTRVRSVVMRMIWEESHPVIPFCQETVSPTFSVYMEDQALVRKLNWLTASTCKRSETHPLRVVGAWAKSE